MGSCTDRTRDSSNHESAAKAMFLKSSQSSEPLSVDDSHPLMTSYSRNGMIFTKTNYDWFSIPVSTPIYG